MRRELGSVGKVNQCTLGILRHHVTFASLEVVLGVVLVHLDKPAVVADSFLKVLVFELDLGDAGESLHICWADFQAHPVLLHCLFRLLDLFVTVPSE